MSWQQVVTHEDKKATMLRVWEMVCKGALKGPVLVTLGRPGKSREQEKKYHAIINDIFRTGVTDDGEPISTKLPDTAMLKALLVGRFEQDLYQQGEKLRNPGRYVFDWERGWMVHERPSTTKFTVEEASQFIEFLYSEGAKYRTKWSPIVTQIYNEYREAA